MRVFWGSWLTALVLIGSACNKQSDNQHSGSPDLLGVAPGGDGSMNDLTGVTPADFPPGADLLAASSDLLPGADLLQCPDDDGDGYSPVAGCTAIVDCADNDANNWTSCSTCLDEDGDGFYAGCDAYVSRLPDCDDGDVMVSHTPETLASLDTDADCDGRDFAMTDDQVVFVATDGDDFAQGTQDAPVQTLGRALDLAVGARRVIALASGHYAESIHVTGSGFRSLSIIGGLVPGSWTMATGGGPGEYSELEGLDYEGPVVNAKAQAKLFSAHKLVFVSAPTVLLNTDARLERTGNQALSIDGGSLTLSSGSFVSLACTHARADLSGATGHFGSGVSGILADTGCALSTTNVSLVSTASGERIAVDGRNATSMVHDHLAVSLPYVNDLSPCTGVAVGDGDAAIVNATMEMCSVGAQSTGVLGQGTGTITMVNSIVKPEAAGNGKGSIGVLTDGNPVVLINNLLDSGSRSTGSVVQLTAPGTAALYNNAIVRSDNGSGIQVSGTAAVTLRNNAISVISAQCLIDSGVCASSEADLNNCSKWTGCSASTANKAAACSLDWTNHLVTDTNCKSAGTDPSSVYATPIVDIDGAGRPDGSWDIGPDEVPN